MSARTDEILLNSLLFTWEDQALQRHAPFTILHCGVDGGSGVFYQKKNKRLIWLPNINVHPYPMVYISYSDSSLDFEKRSFQNDSDLRIKSLIAESAPKSIDILAQPP